MNITVFYLLTGAVLVSIYLFFKPLKVDIAETEELAQIELERFTVHEVTDKGVKTILAGAYARRYENRYEVDELNLTDRSEMHTENMKAGYGIYREPMIFLKNEVRYRRDDGVAFETKAADYNQTSGTISAPGDFVLLQGRDRVDGQELVYNTQSGNISAKRITGNYFLEEDK